MTAAAENRIKAKENNVMDTKQSIIKSITALVCTILICFLSVSIVNKICYTENEIAGVKLKNGTYSADTADVISQNGEPITYENAISDTVLPEENADTASDTASAVQTADVSKNSPSKDHDEKKSRVIIHSGQWQRPRQQSRRLSAITIT